MKGSETMKNKKQKKQSEKPTTKTPVKPSASKTSFDECPFGKEFEFFYNRFMRVL